MMTSSRALVLHMAVRLIEMAAVMPMWTTMIVHYVEGDEGHVMNEQLGNAKWRTKVRGQCFFFIMPWKDMVRKFNKRLQQYHSLADLPRDEEVLQHMLRLHLRVAKKLTQVRLRPFVLVQLLKYMIDQNHLTFAKSM